MFKSRTLFIVGAGASAEVGLPIGSQLAGTISKKLDIQYDDFGQRLISGDVRIFEQFVGAFRNEVNEYQKACWLIRDGIRLSNSIDDFLDVHSQIDRVKRVGKTAIVRAILEAERSSKLFYDTSRRDRRIDLATLEGTWFIKFVRMLGRGVPLEKIDTIFDNVAFIVFNHDRCIEHFLFLAIQQLYAIDGRTAAKLLSKLCIIHPYGVVAELPFTSGEGVAYGGPGEHHDAPYLGLSDRIRTYTEQIGDPAELNAIREQVSVANKIVFL